MSSTSKRSLEGLVMAYLVDNKQKRADFAHMMGVKSWRTAKNKIRGDSPLLFSEATTLCDVLGLSFDELKTMV